MISWMTREDDLKAHKSDCDKCEVATSNNASFPHRMPCAEHELEYANQKVTVIHCEFLDPENPKVGGNYINDLIIDPAQKLDFLIDHIRADEYEKRTTVLSLTTKEITRDELNTLQEWEP